ncbi:MAG: SAM-dependent methyltransferase, partial [Lachnospiraceae bacterium]|nr:SAM-dependent methyltransferase [Lachnospiraceae bacterium]
ECIYEFVSLASRLLSKDAIFFLLNSYTTGLQSGVMDYIVRDIIVREHGGKTEAGEIGIPVKDSGLILPEGNSVRWLK